MTDEQETSHAFARSRSNAGLGEIDASMVKRLAEQTTLNLWPGWVNDGRGLLNLIAFAKAVSAYERERIAVWYETTNLKDKKFHAAMIRANTPNV